MGFIKSFPTSTHISSFSIENHRRSRKDFHVLDLLDAIIMNLICYMMTSRARMWSAFYLKVYLIGSFYHFCICYYKLFKSWKINVIINVHATPFWFVYWSKKSLTKSGACVFFYTQVFY